MMIAFFSCKHEKIEAGVENTVNSMLPDVRNGRLYFASIPELKKYYLFLSERIRTFDGSDFENADDMLLSIEKQGGYTSLRSVLSSDLTSSNRDSLPDFILDDIRESILNEYYEVQVAEFVYVYMSENQVYKIPLSNAQDIALLRETPKGNDLLNLLTKIEPDTELSSKLMWITGFRDTYENCQLNAALSYNASQCQPLVRNFSGEANLNMDDSIGNTVTAICMGDYAIHFGDGSPVLVLHNVWTTAFSHTYPGPGDYQLTVYFTYTNPCDDISEMTVTLTDPSNNSVHISGSDCANVSLSQVFHDESNNKRMTSEAWVRHDFLGEHQGATTKSYEWKWQFDHYTWRPENAYVKAEINWHFRNNICEDVGDPIWASGLETDICNTCDSKRACRTHSGDGDLSIGNQEVFSSHRVVNEGIVLDRQITFGICN